MSAQSAGPVKYVPHLFLLAVLVVEFLLGHATRMDDDELRRTSEEGTTQERLWAWHVLANRDPDGFAFKDHHLKDLLNDPDPLIVDYAFTIDICRLIQAKGLTMRQEARIRKPLKGGSGVPRPDAVSEWWRRYVIFRRKVGGKPVGGHVRLQRQELAWYLQAMDGEELDEKTLVDSTNQRQLQSYAVRQRRNGTMNEPWPGYEAGRLPSPETLQDETGQDPNQTDDR